MKKHSDVVTFGCRLNAYESEVMKEHAEKAGLEGAIIFNTCAVTNEAVRQARQAIRKARREHPDARIIVTGCAAQIAPAEFAQMPEVDLVLGNDEKMKAESWQPAVALHSNEKVIVNDIMSVRETAGHLVHGFEGRARAFVQVQNGCDHRCTFCIIPYGRGNSRSVAAGEVVAQVRTLVEAGYREVVLTGVDITSYGSDLPGHPSLGNLARRILKLVPELERLRLSSIDSIEADDELMRLIAEEERLMPHLHLSLQSGDNMILKRMKRRHLREDSIRFCTEARRLRPDIVFGADFIAGFPTETEEMFENTLRLVDECGLTWLHVFPFSPRPGTPAARMPQVDRAIIKSRAERLRAKGAERVRLHLEEGVGSTRTVLMESETLGRTNQFTPVHLVNASVRPGEILDVRLAAHDGVSFQGQCAA
ncbi:MAG TPA: tRNA (N(6)-L-threonylcarbamoyladenosine(37)-C(2))-methylthiotransferase MtaB [Parvibaculum sp.]|uniref:tRNA (N(6)-L-threonylcarbamoyladenosine(37)-C(2))- methylthiotransferase MtaB n=1 Tax=Parvibaculum sp. TaxID=2024848 RepID=UPI002BA16703|nr:tRNA (N(6)-L-threonylcarbamoyladenosine(37)-C(2))-methylthiotransferase MtaB [Parvibaculum sp.]HMM15199.1 tRNA (N(6)-L-threonylcarbamoyladenosine(37)-C(2))-methylthiotransferase MtaB [Parvibaculum sp.]